MSNKNTTYGDIQMSLAINWEQIFMDRDSSINMKEELDVAANNLTRVEMMCAQKEAVLFSKQRQRLSEHK